MAVTIDFTGKTVLITGAGRGIGKDVALAFADAGAKVYIGNRKEKEGQATVDEIIAKGGKAGFTRCDVAIKEDVEKLVADAISFGGGVLDCIVNCAGVASTTDTINISDEEFRRIIDVNLLGTTHILQAGFAHMCPRGAGNIVTYSSIAGRHNGGDMPHYCASKAGVINLTQGAARLAAPYGVRVNSIAPGDVHTGMWDQIIDGIKNGFTGDLPADALSKQERDDVFAGCIKDGTPLGRPQTGEDMAMATLFIASDLAKNITGQTLTIDGGKTMV